MSIAWEYFRRDGYAGASMAQITQRTGGSKSGLYSHYRSKQDLFFATIRKLADETYLELKDAPAMTGRLENDLREFGYKLLGITLSAKYLAFYRVLVAEAVRFPIIGTTEYANRSQNLLAPLRQRLGDEMKDGKLRADDPTEAAEVLWTLLSARLHRLAVMTTTAARSKRAIRQFVDRAVAIFLRAYAPSARRQSHLKSKRPRRSR